MYIKYIMYIYTQITSTKNKIMKIQLLQDLATAKKALSYTNKALNSNLENWERKEFEAVKIDLTNDINSLEKRIAICM